MSPCLFQYQNQWNRTRILSQAKTENVSLVYPTSVATDSFPPNTNSIADSKSDDAAAASEYGWGED